MAWQHEPPTHTVPPEHVEQQLRALEASTSSRQSCAAIYGDGADAYTCRCARCCEDRAKRIRARAALTAAELIQ